ncbi:MAG: hypothetical protein Q8R57_14495 [Bacteroidota bacterium]|nr:hypothetical protein [Bacteroidota bacterium]
MHYFIDHNQLTDQNATGIPYGLDSTDPTNKFNITSRFQLTGQAKAFACQDGMMIVQQSSVNTSLVNVILKPIEGLKIPFRSVKYFVYRGLLKDSFIIGAAIKSNNLAPANSFLKRFWEDVDHWNNNNPSNQSTPTPQSLGYDDTLSNTLDIEKIYDNSQTDVRAIFVKEGEWIGDFGTSEPIGFEVILETDSFFVNDFNYRFDLNYLRAENKFIDVSGLSGFDKRAKQELILSYIDPAAFFGLHYEAGVNISVFSGGNKTFEKKKQNDIFTLLLDKFATKNRVYLDIRSEKGYSYNFYQNYKGPIGDPTYGTDLLIGDDYNFQSNGFYQENGWPIKFFESNQTTSANENKMFIALRTDDNTEPILFTEDKFKKSGNRFLSGTQLFGSVWTQPIEFAIPNIASGSTKNNIAYCIKLQYFRGKYNSASPNTVLKNEYYFDSSFCPIDLPNLADTNYLFNQVHNSDLNFVRGVLPGISNEFGYVAGSGAYWDSSRIVFFSQAIFQNKNTRQFFDSVTNWGLNFGFNLDSSYFKMSFLSKDIQVAKTNIQEVLSPNVYQKIKMLDIVNYNGFPNCYENVLCFGITQSELIRLKDTGSSGNATEFSKKHHRYIYIEEVGGSLFADKDGKPFRKFKVKVQGLKSNGEQVILAPSENNTPLQDVYVYNQLGLVFASKDFADQETNQLGLVYKRNYEENIGYANNKKDTSKHIEDYFIEDINPNMKTEVDGFINALATVANDENAYQNIKTLVEDSAKDIWDEAVSFVKANISTTPDDRPLYWARNKMQVALKSHPYFENQFLFSEVNPGSELEAMVKIFEEKSRNYSGVDFSGAPVGAKKILITGFDPFQLDPKYKPYGAGLETSNPSGLAALALHNSTITDGTNTGYIQVAVFPVRYYDFDRKVVENLVETYLQNNSIQMIMTLSLNGGNYYFDLERFAGKKRGGGADNLNIQLSSSGFKQIQDTEKGNEFYQTTLPVSNIITNQVASNFNLSSQRFFYDQSYIANNKRKHITKDSINQPNTNTDSFLISEISGKSEEGSGSNYLSNEIFYRVARIREKTGNISSVKTGHFHLPNPSSGNIPSDSSIVPFTIVEIIEETKNAIIRCLSDI